ncbi:Ku protein [Alkalisalibacterium limincola]|uniref:Non-homologous end joining protein Ku n=1 Tax=Alkalisalibacterium limincola TaxID=2699169 RepID=A0A5C8KPZ7_9GAMM|nr:Ku protein [Alkalisalibacterium limincola]TXK62329.1 Ku protein [Alkalisalibacterium limincola]
MARPIWTGNLSFGLLNVPVALMAGERKVDLSLRMLDSRDNTPIRYERVNADTGEEVPWGDIVKAFEYEKGSYVVIEKEDIASAAPERHESVDIEAFVDVGELGPRSFDKPYILVPGKKAEKGYVLLRETLKETGKAGVARVVIRTREYLCAVVPEDDALVLILMRYPQELVDPADYALPDKAPSEYRISKKEIEMAKSLVESMSTPWSGDDYRDDFRDRLAAIIRERVESTGSSAAVDEEVAVPDDAATNVVDFMSLLKKSLSENKRTPAKKAARTKGPDKRGTKQAASKKPAPKKPSAKKSATAKRAPTKAGTGKSTAKKAASKKSAATKAPAKSRASTASKRKSA